VIGSQSFSREEYFMTRKRGKGEGTIYQRNDGYWIAQVTTGYDENGKQKRKTITGQSRIDVSEKLKTVLGEQQRDELVDKNNILFKDWLNNYLFKYKKLQIRQSTFDKYESLAKTNIYPYLGQRKLQDIRTSDIQNLISMKANELSSATVREIHQIISQSLKQACIERMVHRNEAEYVTLPKIIQQEIIPLLDSEIKRLLNVACGHWLYPALLLEMGTGLRRGELLALLWRNVNFDAKTITITQSYVKTTIGNIIQKPKTKSSIRVITVPGSIMAILKRYKDASTSNYVFTQKKSDNPVSPRHFSKIFEGWCTRAELATKRFHDLRHTYASQLLASNVHMKVVQAQLGHADIKVTMNRYSHLTQSQLQEASDKLDKKFKKIKLFSPPPIPPKQQ
jgi:integrase